MSDLLDILSDIKNDTVTPKPLVAEPTDDRAITKLTGELKDLSHQSAGLVAVESVRSERAISKAFALEVFTMLPNIAGDKLDSKLTIAPSEHNRELLLSRAGGTANFSNQYGHFVREVRDIVRDRFVEYDELVTSCTTFLDITSTMMTELLVCNPTIVSRGKILKLLDHDVVPLAYLSTDGTSNDKRNLEVRAFYRKLSDSASFADISREKGFKTSDSDESLGITVTDIVSHLTDIAKLVTSKANELTVIHHNLEVLLSDDKINPSIPSVYFESIFETLENVKRNSLLFTSPVNTANAVTALLKFLD